MKLSCEIIQDLLPLLEDDVCSAESRAAVMEHIKTCENCRKLYEAGHADEVVPVTSPEEKQQEKALKNGFRKVKRTWSDSIIAVFLLIPFFFLLWGQYWGVGLSFTNLHEVLIAKAFVKDLKTGEYESAFQRLDLDSEKTFFLDEWFEEEDLVNFEEDAHRMFLESAQRFIDAGGIQEAKFLSVSANPGFYQLHFTVIIDGAEEKMTLDVNDRGVMHFSGQYGFSTDPLSYFGGWSEWLWEEYQGCTFDPNQGYVDNETGEPVEFTPKH